ncbi:MAG: hypothetical protein ABSC56_01875 [Solirubrobacteraceae bacterium]|jgi:hypothetical protein
MSSELGTSRRAGRQALAATTEVPPVARPLALRNLRTRRRDRGARRTDAWLAWDEREVVSSRAAERIARVSLIAMILASLWIVSAAAAHTSFLSPTAREGDYPTWLAGPLGPLTSWHTFGTHSLEAIFTFGAAAMYIGYAAILICAPRLRPTWPLAGMVLLQLIYYVSPPLPLTDIFNYLNYGRMEVVHHLNPYTTIPALEPHTDPTFGLSNWHGLESPYGPLFTLITLVVVPLGVAGSYWAMKTLLLITSLASVRLIWSAAGALGRNQLGAALFVGLNPIVLVWGLGADHNDFLMILVIAVAMLLLVRATSEPRPAARSPIGPGLASRVRSMLADARRPVPGWWWEIGAGIALAAAVAIKASAAILVPVIFAGSTRRMRFGAGLAIGLVGFGAAAYAAFGANLPNLSQQSGLVIPLGLPNLTGYLLGFGGETTGWRDVLNLALVASVIACTVWAWRAREWVRPAAWVTFALLLTLSWVLPWYLIWLLPFAALARPRRIRVAALLLGVYLFLGWMPYATSFWRDIGIDPATTITGRADARYLHTLIN